MSSAPITKLPQTSACPHTVSASGSPASAQGASEGYLFAGQKDSRVPPSIKAASEAGAVSHAAAAERRPLGIVKKLYKRLRFSPTPKKGPAGARGEARRLPRRKAPISTFATVASIGVPHTISISSFIFHLSSFIIRRRCGGGNPCIFDLPRVYYTGYTGVSPVAPRPTTNNRKPATDKPKDESC